MVSILRLSSVHIRSSDYGCLFWLDGRRIAAYIVQYVILRSTVVNPHY